MTDKTIEGELASCPFCGVTLVRREMFGVAVARWMHPDAGEDHDGCLLKNYHVRELPESIAAWNRRPAIEPSPITGDARIGELEHSLSHANDVIGLERAARKSAETNLAFVLEKFVPGYEPWMDKYPDDTPSSLYRTGTFGDIRRARAALTQNTETR